MTAPVTASAKPLEARLPRASASGGPTTQVSSTAVASTAYEARSASGSESRPGRIARYGRQKTSARPTSVRRSIPGTTRRSVSASVRPWKQRIGFLPLDGSRHPPARLWRHASRYLRGKSPRPALCGANVSDQGTSWTVCGNVGGMASVAPSRSRMAIPDERRSATWTRREARDGASTVKASSWPSWYPL